MIYLYLYENKINGKVYVGQTVDLKSRDWSHQSSLTKTGFDGALKKWGRENFDLTVFDIVYSEEEADHTEMFWIAKTREVLGRDNVYNLADGGKSTGSRGAKMSEEAKKKISLANIGEKNPFYGRTHTDENKAILSEKAIERIKNQSPEIKKKIADAALKGKAHPNFGKPLSEETKAKISATLMGPTHGGRGKKRSSEICEKIRAGKMGEKNPNFGGRSMTEETKKKISLANTGENNKNAKLTVSNVIEIKRLLKETDLTAIAISKMFKVSESLIREISHQRAWKSVK